MRRIGSLALSLLVSGVCTLVSPSARAQAPAAAEPSAEEVLKKADTAYANFSDLIVESRMEIKEPGASAARVFGFTTTIKGDKRLVRFNSPGDIKGMGFLAEGRDTIYVYLPGFQKVRRMGTHIKNQGFMGSDASYEDMSEGTYGGVYAPKNAGSDEKNYILDLTLLPGKEAEYPKLKVWFDKTLFVATRIEFYDAAGNKARSQLRSDFRKDEGDGNHYTPWLIRIIDHRRNDHSTDLNTVKAQVNQKVSDDAFSQRSLIRGGN